MRKILVAAILLVFVMLVLLAYQVASTLSMPDAPGGWVPSPAGSGWCVSKSVPGLKDGTIARCPTPSK